MIQFPLPSTASAAESDTSQVDNGVRPFDSPGSPRAVLRDKWGRGIDYLRLAITDRCNLACTYCVPLEGVTTAPKSCLMTDDEIIRLTAQFVALGITKVRLTGGDPLVRARVPDLVARLADLLGLETLVLTTNAIRLAPLAKALRQAGLQGVNISLDTLDPARYSTITGGGQLHRAMAGLWSAVDEGLKVKVNAVATARLTDADLEQFIHLARHLDVEVRFIEYMPLCGSAWDRRQFLSMAELRKRLERLSPLVPAPGSNGVSLSYRLPGGQGRIGFIASISRPFCGDCSRIRLSAKGEVQGCLFESSGLDLLTPLREGADDETIRGAIRLAAWKKSPGHGYDPTVLENADASQHGTIRTIGG